jgi:ketosteroid isomerase-like protein
MPNFPNVSLQQVMRRGAMRHGITWIGAIVAFCNFTAAYAQDTRESDPVAVTRSFLGAWAASSVDDLMKFMADDSVVVGSSGARFTGEPALRRVLGNMKGLQNRDYEVRLDGDRVAARGKTYGFTPYVELGVEPGEWDGSAVVKNGRIVFYEWYYTPEFNAKLEQACLQKADYLIAGAKCLDFAARAKAHTESARRK